MKLLVSLLAILLINLNIYPQNKQKDEFFSIVFYNVENLFDTVNDPDIEDDEFTPGGSKKWDIEKYSKKLKDLSEVFYSTNKKELPEIIGLCEVENKKVLKDLIATKKLRRGNYKIVHKNSRDTRGIDAALLYRPDQFRYITHKSIPINFRYDTVDALRSILYVKGKSSENQLFHFFVNHWKSRSGGQSKTEPKRIFSAVTLRRAVDSILNFEQEAKIIIMGDFNDDPTNKSVHSILQANNKQKNAGPRELYNLMYDKHNLNNTGTYSYKGNWYMFDQIIVSQKILNDKNNYYCDFESGTVFQDKWMMYDNPKVESPTPNKTYGGDMYFGGVSDHLPVFVVLTKN